MKKIEPVHLICKLLPMIGYLCTMGEHCSPLIGSANSQLKSYHLRLQSIVPLAHNTMHTGSGENSGQF